MSDDDEYYEEVADYDAYDDPDEEWSESDEQDELWSEPGDLNSTRADLCLYGAWGIVILLGLLKVAAPPDSHFRNFAFCLFLAAPIFGALLGLSSGYRHGRKMVRAVAGLLAGVFLAFVFAMIYDAIAGIVAPA